MGKLSSLLFFIFVPTSFGKTEGNIRLIFEEEKGMRSSFCMYSDGRFYETRASGCIGQEFAFGYWEDKNDTITLHYQADNIFNYDVLKSHDTDSKHQVIKIVDCYDQPVRFQAIYCDTTWQDLFNPAILRVEKGKAISYPAPLFNNDSIYYAPVITKSDTITYKWRCNRESIESINGGSLFTNQEARKSKIVLRNNVVIQLYY